MVVVVGVTVGVVVGFFVVVVVVVGVVVGSVVVVVVGVVIAAQQEERPLKKEQRYLNPKCIRRYACDYLSIGAHHTNNSWKHPFSPLK